MATNLEVKPVKNFAGVEFHIPAYQRGYRWRKPQTEQLLRDIEEAMAKKDNQPYMLQPIVLKRLSQSGKDLEKKDPERFEVIDGQQRLTTIWIILQYIRNGRWRSPRKYSLIYDSNVEETNFLDDLGTEKQRKVETMDEDFFVKSYNAVKKYFEEIRDRGQLDDDAWSDYVVAFCKYLQESVEVIWYEIDTVQSDRDGEEIFMSLNRGRIPLESSELIKTLLLVRASRSWDDKREDTERQTEIATEWDEMERSFSDPEFWAFIGGDDGDGIGKPRMGYFLEMLPPPEYFLEKLPPSEGAMDNLDRGDSGQGGAPVILPPPLDFLKTIPMSGNLMNDTDQDDATGAGTRVVWNDQDGDDYKVFNRYEKIVHAYDRSSDEKRRSLDLFVLEEIWRGHIRANYLKLKDWAEDVRMFHKLGFLIAVKKGNTKDRMDLLCELLKHKGLKSELELVVDEKIKDLFKGMTREKIETLQYKHDNECISRLLLLFNVVSCMEEAEKFLGAASEWYSFARHDAEDWSLEHINPQRELKIAEQGDRKAWEAWLKGQRPFLKLAPKNGDNLALKTDEILKDIDKLDVSTFKDLSGQIVDAFSTKFDHTQEHTLGNLALLSKRDNSSIGASIFLGKRQDILDKIANGRFVPFCTRRVFLKHYTMLDGACMKKDVDPGEYGLVFWTTADADNYLEKIISTVDPYVFNTVENQKVQQVEA